LKSIEILLTLWISEDTMGICGDEDGKRYSLVAGIGDEEQTRDEV
jgi:hypothetical protein